MPFAQKRIEFIIIACLVLVLSAATYKRNFVWLDHLSLWSDCVRKSSNKARPYFSLGVAYQGRGLVDEAINRYKKALALRPNYATAHHNLGKAYGELGRFKEEFEQYQEAIRINPRLAEAHYNMGSFLEEWETIGRSYTHITGLFASNWTMPKRTTILERSMRKWGFIQKLFRHLRRLSG